MKLQALFTINLVIAVILGIVSAVFPGWVFQLYGLTSDAGGLWMTRLVGGAFLGFATLMWFGRRTSSGEARRAIALALLAKDAIGFVASLEIQLTGTVNASGWAGLVVYGLLALAYAYFLFVRPQDS